MTNKTHEADVSFIKALAELLRDNDLTELQVKRDYGEDDSLNVRVSRQIMAAPGRPRSGLCSACRGPRCCTCRRCGTCCRARGIG